MWVKNGYRVRDEVERKHFQQWWGNCASFSPHPSNLLSIPPSLPPSIVTHALTFSRRAGSRRLSRRSQDWSTRSTSGWPCTPPSPAWSPLASVRMEIDREAFPSHIPPPSLTPFLFFLGPSLSGATVVTGSLIGFTAAFVQCYDLVHSELEWRGEDGRRRVRELERSCHIFIFLPLTALSHIRAVALFIIIMRQRRRECGAVSGGYGRLSMKKGSRREKKNVLVVMWGGRSLDEVPRPFDVGARCGTGRMRKTMCGRVWGVRVLLLARASR